MPRPLTARSDFAAAVNQIAHERGLERDLILDTIKQAILAAFKKDYPDQYQEEESYSISLDPSTGEARIKDSQSKDVTPPGFGRIAAQNARQVLFQKIHEAEKSHLVDEYTKRLGSLTSGQVVRILGTDVIVEIGKAEAVLPRDQQTPSENYRLNQKLTLLLQSIREGPRGREIVVSRADPALVKELFRREVPEVNSGAVEIKAIARDPGSRTKVAVYSNQSSVDPVGSCVGQKGIRVQEVINELNGEKIDVIQYSDDPAKFVAAALSPAESLSVKIIASKGLAQVTAPSDQLSLAIGREGQNARLAGRLTSFHIDVQALPEEKGTSEHAEPPGPNPNPQ